MTMHVALYCRISKADTTESIDDHKRWGMEYAAAAWPGQPVVAYCDNDRSSTKEDVSRPGYDQLREAIAAGKVSHLWAKEQSRIERDEVPWFLFAAFAASHGLAELHSRQSGIVPMKGLITGVRAVINAEEIRVLKDRVNDKLQKRAQSGLPPGSKPFGYEHALTAEGVKTYAQVPEQAEAIRWAADRVLAGWSLSRVTAGLHDQGLHGPHRVKIRNADGQVVTEDGRVWDRYDPAQKPATRSSMLTSASVRNMLTNPTIAGRRVHHGRDLGPETGNWDPILDDATWHALVRKLGAKRTVMRETKDGREKAYVVIANRPNPPGRKYLLTGGLAVCGVCEAPLSGTLKQLHKGKVKPYLACHPKTGGKGCIGIMLPEVEAYVVDRMWAELDNPAFLARLADDGLTERRQRITASLAVVGTQREELAAMWGQGELTTPEWKAARQGLDDQEAKLTGALAALPPPLVKVDIATARKAWPLMELDEKREFIRLFVEQVTIRRAVPGRKGFDKGRVAVDFR